MNYILCIFINIGLILLGVLNKGESNAPYDRYERNEKGTQQFLSGNLMVSLRIRFVYEGNFKSHLRDIQHVMDSLRWTECYV
jgi:hypothetical protein